MRITLDTNVLVSAFISKEGQPAALLDTILAFSELDLVLSEPILEELSDVLSRENVRRRFGYAAPEIKSLVRTIREASIIVGVKSIFRVVVEDANDDVIINTAYDGKAGYIVSGDKHLLRIRRFRGIRIVSTASMLKIIKRRFGEFIISG
jgi:putative PIN family toxin of toxin-antitoxin system